jgi:aminopeptidase N
LTTENLTRDEAADRARLIADVETIVRLDLTGGPETFGVVSELRFRCEEPGATSFVDATCVTIQQIVLNGIALDPNVVAGDTRIELPNLASDNTLTIVAVMPYKHEGKGLHRFVDPSDQRVYLHSQCEPFDAHLIYPCFDQPDLKTTFDLQVEAPAEWVCVSNEVCIERPSDGAAGTWRFDVTPRISPYITAIVAGSYAEFRFDDEGEIPQGFYVRRSLASALERDLPELLEVTRQGLSWMAEAFGTPYPFTKYDQLFVPEFSAGAMENPGCITFSETFVFRSKVTDARNERRAEVVLHEMAHMWFGDLVTMRWWDDLWLNESFATFMALLSQVEATRWPDAWVTFNDAEKAWALLQDQLPTTHPIAADMHDILAVHQNFDGITYAKGASVLRQLVAWVGQDAFLDGCKQYFQEHAWGNAELSDFLGALEEASGRELRSWSKEWLETTGVNTLEPVLTLSQDGSYDEVAILQSAVADHPTLRRHRIGVGVYDATDAGLVRRMYVELDVAGPRTVVTELAGVAAGDVLLTNDGDLTFCKVRLDAASTTVLQTKLHSFVDALPRTVVWSAAWDMVRDGQMPVGTYLELLRNNVMHESEVGVLERLLGRATASVTRYGDQSKVTERLTALADAARAKIDDTEPGSDVQLAWVRHWASCASSAAQTDAVEQLLDGGISLPGLSVDTDLRWHLLVSLAASGVAGEERIAAEYARDKTDLGERQAATARAAQPHPAAKHSAWDRLVNDASLSHTVGRQLWGGMFQLTQAEPLAGFDRLYFDALDRVWSERSIDWALEWSQGCFPHPLASQGLYDEVDTVLARTDLPGPLRRVLLEQQDTLARTLRARAADV